MSQHSSWRRKKAFQGSELHCVFCQKQGHDVAFCPSKRTTVYEHNAFAERIITAPQRDCAKIFEHKSLKEAMSIVERDGALFNENNPWIQSDKPRDSLRKNIGYWKAIGAPANIISWLIHGAELRMVKPPTPMIFKNHPSYYQHIDFVDEEVQKHLADGSFIKVDKSFVTCSSPIQVEVNSRGKKRMCIDARYPNSHLAQAIFKMESLERCIPEVIEKDMLMFTTDIKKAYYSVPVQENSWTYQCFEHKNEYIAATILLFGGSQAPLFFNKIRRAELQFVRTLGIHTSGFYDDNLWAEHKNKSAQLVEFVQWFLPRLGWKLNDKCIWNPSNTAQYLGMEIDSKIYEIRVPEDKMQHAERLILELIEKADAMRAIDVQQLQSIIGKLMSMKLAVYPVRVWTRYLYRDIAKAVEHQRVQIALSPDATEELHFWKHNLRKYNGNAIKHPRHQISLHCDAGETGWGGHCESKECAGAFEESLIGKSSTERELTALLLVGHQLVHNLRNKRVEIVMDSNPAIRNLMKGGGPKPHLCNTVKEWWTFCDKNNIRCTYTWVPREENTRADELSKVNSSKWPLSRQSIITIRQNRRFSELPMYSPDYNQISNTINHMMAKREIAILIHPRWPAQIWWPTLLKLRRDQIELGTMAKACIATNHQYRPWHLLATIVDARE
jgi:hypothetical protein